MASHTTPQRWVIIPAYCEERLIARAIANVPAFVDKIIVIDDASPDRTAEMARAVGDPRVTVLVREANGGVGAAIIDGYRSFLHGTSEDASSCVVMAGDAQMDPNDLPRLLNALADGVDYAKGNRFLSAGTWRAMPCVRWLGNRFLSSLTAWVTGIDVGDSQCGYTAITRGALSRLPLHRLYARYGFPNDMLVKASAAGLIVRDVAVRAVYADEASGLSPWRVGPRIVGILWRGRAEIASGRRASAQRPSPAVVGDAQSR